MKGKFFVAIAFAAAMALGLCACGGSSNAPAAAEGEYATMADVFAAEGTDTMWTYDDKVFSYAFKDGDVYKHVVVELPDGMKDSLDKADFDDAKIAELLSALPIAKQETIEPPSQEEIDAYIGKTGADLVAEGYDLSNFVVNGKETDCSAVKTPFSYLFTFDGAIDENTKDANEALKDLKVKSVAIQGVDFSALETE